MDGGVRSPRPTEQHEGGGDKTAGGEEPRPYTLQKALTTNEKSSAGGRCSFIQRMAYTYRWVVTSNTPRVVIRRLGITGSAMKLSVMKGSMPLDTPSL